VNVVPALAFAVDVRRGERRYPLTLHWLMAAGSFAPLCCSNCGALETLVAGRTHFGPFFHEPVEVDWTCSR
jgi:hypothetical protein